MNPTALQTYARHTVALAVAASIAVPTTVLAGGPAVHAVAIGSAQAVANPQTKVEVAVQLDGSDDAVIADRVKKGASDSLGGSEVDVVVEGDAPSTVNVSVGWNADDNHEIKIEVVNEGEAPQALEGSPFVCEECGENELIAKVNSLVAGCVPLLAVPEVPVPADDGADDDGGEDDGVEVEDDGDDGEEVVEEEEEGTREGLGPVGKAGIGVVILGLGASVGGSVLVSMGREDGDVSGDPAGTESTDFRPPGVAVIAVGGTALAAGLMMLIGDLRSPKRKRRKKKTAVAPSVAPRFTGVSVSGRF